MLPERVKEIKESVTVQNPWPFEFVVDGATHQIDAVKLKCPTLLDLQLLSKKKVDGRDYDAALIAQLGNIPERAVGSDGFADPFRAMLIHRYSEFFDEETIDKIQVGAREHRKDIEPYFDYELRTPVEIRGEPVATIRINPPPISAFKYVRDPEDFCLWAPAFLARVCTFEKNPGEWRPLDGNTCQTLSVQDANEITVCLDFFSPADLLVPLVAAGGDTSDR